LIAEQVVRIDVHKDRLIVRFRSADTEEGSHSTDDGQLLSIPCPPRSNAERSAQFRGVVVGLTRSSQARPLTSSRSHTPKMQRATGQYDHLARVPRTGPRQSHGRRSFSSRYWCRAAPRRARGMEPTVRNLRIESAMGSEAARSSLLGRLCFIQKTWPPCVPSVRSRPSHAPSVNSFPCAALSPITR
jgi:hypothetical protein